ncbi:hypothetical protein [Laspinema olomoucense]|uniref:Uncharacterized protein n=1 Tax=Laspinema olomoucense D3b TaxID=2953688 RepID=A0ABT2NDC0_9CYAN|nr:MULTISPECIES: hypothetical protein [unclassified Laspinema]MCT7971781.1 hypothetical protein [Laspinema sp. D3d]MCT7979340.1 hypothetical protein [Laspinema sp. D3b]MCT7989139.1 hypothetical protein [Laspinema sp. D3a]MCT7993386.1 hypothetical protein [Laspinema sp. D3c]
MRRSGQGGGIGEQGAIAFFDPKPLQGLITPFYARWGSPELPGVHGKHRE